MAGGLIFGNAFPLNEGCTGTFPEFCPTAAGRPRRGPPVRQTGPGRQCAREKSRRLYPRTCDRASDLSKRNEVAMHPTLSQDRLYP